MLLAPRRPVGASCPPVHWQRAQRLKCLSGHEGLRRVREREIRSNTGDLLKTIPILGETPGDLNVRLKDLFSKWLKLESATVSDHYTGTVPEKVPPRVGSLDKRMEPRGRKLHVSQEKEPRR